MFNDMKVGTRLILGFLVVTLLGAVVAGIGIRNMGKLNDEAERVYRTELLGLAHIKDANLNLSNLGRSLRNALLASSEQDRKKFVDDAHVQKRLLEQNLNEARQRFVTDKGKAMLADLDAKLGAYQPLLAQLFDRIDKAPLLPPSDTTEFLYTSYSASLAPVTALLNDLSDIKEANAKKVAEDSAALYASSRNSMIVLVLLSGVVGLGIGILITRRLTRQLGGEPDYAVAVAERIAAGDLVTQVDIRPGDEHSLLHAMQQMRASLGSIVSQVRNGTHAIESASSEIAAGNLDLSARTEQQASSLEETASSMEELTSTVKQNADNARQANALALSASEVATRGGAVVSQVVNTMSSINDSSRRIVDIISVIDGIAFQTNILALNAAVEAARAGEQGRGFAVVAGEVRSLAQRSAAAAKEIKQLIDDSVHEVDAGAKLVDQAGRTMEEIVESVRRVTDIMGEITSASVEQTAGIEQINEAVAHMDQVTQQNASLVEEAAAASEALRDQAHQLGEVVRMFRIEETAQQPQETGAAKVVPLARTHGRPAPAAVRIAHPLPAKAANGDEWEEF